MRLESGYENKFLLLFTGNYAQKYFSRENYWGSFVKMSMLLTYFPYLKLDQEREHLLIIWGWRILRNTLLAKKSPKFSFLHCLLTVFSTTLARGYVGRIVFGFDCSAHWVPPVIAHNWAQWSKAIFAGIHIKPSAESFGELE